MAFTTINGASATDATTFAGTSGVDVATIISAGNYYLYGAQANDVVTSAVGGVGGVVSAASLNGGAGNDQILYATTTFSAGSVNGNQGNDTLTFGAVYSSTVNGGQGLDTITIAGGSSVYSNGNKESDQINITAALSQSTVRGGQSGDAIVINTTGAITNVAFYGDKGNDNINDAAAAFTGTGASAFGGDGEDTITWDNTAANNYIDGGADRGFLTGGGGNDTVIGGTAVDVITGGAGGDSMTGGGGNDTYQAVIATSGVAASAIANGVATFANGVDVITDFSAGAAGDVVNYDGTAITAIAAGTNNFTTNNTAATITTFTGTYSGTTFTFDANGADTLIAYANNAGAATIAAAAQGNIILKGVTAATLVAANFS